MKLYYFESPNSIKPCAVAKYLDAPVEYVRVDLTKGEHKQPDFLAVNPNGKAPALLDGDMRLWESHAIMAYQAQKAGSNLWPTDPVEQVDVLRWLNWDTAHFFRHAANLWSENVFKQVIGRGDPDEAAVEEATGFVRQFGAVLNDHLKGRSHLVGDRLTIADFIVATHLPMAKQARLPIEDFDEIRRWHDSMEAIKAWRNPWPERQPQAA